MQNPGWCSDFFMLQSSHVQHRKDKCEEVCLLGTAAAVDGDISALQKNAVRDLEQSPSLSVLS